jgi:hypothetical protein
VFHPQPRSLGLHRRMSLKKTERSACGVQLPALPKDLKAGSAEDGGRAGLQDFLTITLPYCSLSTNNIYT